MHVHMHLFILAGITPTMAASSAKHISVPPPGRNHPHLVRDGCQLQARDTGKLARLEDAAVSRRKGWGHFPRGHLGGGRGRLDPAASARL